MLRGASYVAPLALWFDDFLLFYKYVAPVGALYPGNSIQTPETSPRGA